MYAGIHNVFLYILTAVNLLLGTLIGTNITVIIQLGMFLLWDYGYFRKKQSLKGRSPGTTVEHVGLLTTWVSYFVPFYGILFGLLFVTNPTKQNEFLELCKGAGIPIWLLLVPFVFASLAAIFVPIQIATHRGETEQISSALKSLFCIKVFFSQTTIFVFVHCMLRLLASLSSLK